jgi:hypothetical protein
VEFMLLFMVREGEPICASGERAEMQQAAAELAREGKLRRGAPLLDESASAWVRVRAGKTFVSDGPFVECKEVVGGVWIVEAASRAEAIEIAHRCPHARYGTVEVHPIQARYTFTDTGKGTPFLFAFRMGPGRPPDIDAKMREMQVFGEGLVREDKLVETAPLANDPRSARIATRGGKVVVTDGPFAETKEGVGGYGLLRVSGRAEAIDIAKRYPHAKWGPVEVRELTYLQPDVSERGA